MSVFSPASEELGTTMVTQAIARWLGRLFAWRPWKHRPETGYAQAVRNVNTGNAQESFWRSTHDGTEPWTGIASVAVEHDNSTQSPDVQHTFPQQRSDSVVQPPGKDSTPSMSDTVSEDPAYPSPFTLPEAQHIEYLRLLIRRGLVNEGFPEGRVPEQYKRYGQRHFKSHDT